MATLDAVNSVTTAGAAASARDRIGQTDFIKLMLAQFRNQDPLKPMNGTEFLGQLAQFGTVTGIEELNGSVGSLAASLRSDQLLSGAALVGRDVLVPGGAAPLPADGTVRGAVDAPAGTQQIVVTVRDAAGQLVRQMTLPAGEGLNEFTWDGLTDTGTRAPEGAYRFAAAAVSGDSQASAQLLIADRVLSVTLDTRRQSLVLNTTSQGAVALADVRRIG